MTAVMTMNSAIPATQYAIQLVGPSELRLNKSKPVPTPKDHEILAKVEAVGLCFSDLKLLKQFNGHARKSEVIQGMASDVLTGIQSYVPGDRPVVPGHEVVCRIVAVGKAVKQHQVGERCLVQTDYRELPTANSNAAFGYNFEGGLQEYVILDERVVVDSTGQRFLIPVSEEKSASAVALVEPWACVEDSYVNRERQGLKAGGKLLVVAEAGHAAIGLDRATAKSKPASVTVVCSEASQWAAVQSLGLAATKAADVAGLPSEAFDDIIYFGASKATIEVLNDKLAPRGLMNVVLGGKTIGQPVSVGVGRVHYGMTRWTGTTGEDAAAAYEHIPATGEIRPVEQVLVVGAGGPMGQMHIFRNVCAGVRDVSIIGTDFDDSRLESLGKKAMPLAKANKVGLRLVNTQKEQVQGKFSYFALMAPVAALVAQAVRDALPGALINIFAGIPAPTKQEIDLDAYIANRCYMFGTSGSVIEDMKIVLRKVESGQLDTNTSVDAISGMAGATAGIDAIEKRTLAGKIIVYPMLHEVGLIPLADLGKHYPTVAAKLCDGQWCREAEEELMRVAGK